jgi:hypothetical protein
MSRENHCQERGKHEGHVIGPRHGTAGIVFIFLLACAPFALLAPDAGAQSNFYVDRGCSGCHGTTPTTCNGCHHHGPSGLSATADKATYAPGEIVIVTLTGGRSSGATVGGGWIRADRTRTVHLRRCLVWKFE